MGLVNKERMKQELAKLQKAYEADDKTRESIISLARKALKHAKQAIYATHRNNLEDAKALLKEAREAINKAQEELDASGLQEVGILHASIEEYIEGRSYLSFVKEGTLPLREDLALTTTPKLETYLQAICDCAGELARKAVLSATKNENEQVEHIYETIQDLVEAFMEFDFRSSELRKKTENLKYSLNKVESILYDLKVKSR